MPRLTDLLREGITPDEVVAGLFSYEAIFFGTKTQTPEVFFGALMGLMWVLNLRAVLRNEGVTLKDLDKNYSRRRHGKYIALAAADLARFVVLTSSLDSTNVVIWLCAFLADSFIPNHFTLAHRHNRHLAQKISRRAGYLSREEEAAERREVLRKNPNHAPGEFWLALFFGTPGTLVLLVYNSLYLWYQHRLVRANTPALSHARHVEFPAINL